VRDIEVVSVSDVNELVRLAIEREPFFANLWVTGEITQATLARSGHLYFTISDGFSRLKVMAWRTVALRIADTIQAGAHVTVNGRLGVYVPNGEYQLVAEFADTTGLGGMALEYARLRQKLEAEGLFDGSRKRPLPSFPRVIGVVTSASGAVIHDIQTVLRRRFPLVHLLLAPAQVQGFGAVDAVRRAHDLLVADGRSDLIIIARGGGSPEDLAAFNDEGLARQIFASPIPVISAIGHESDFTLLDDVADLRAPTPTAAAELSTPDVADFALSIVDAGERSHRQIVAILARKQSDLDALQHRLDHLAPHRALERQRLECVELRERLNRQMHLRIQRERATLAVRQAELGGLGLRAFDRLRTEVAGMRLLLGSPLVRGLASRRISVDQHEAILRRTTRQGLQVRHAAVDALAAQLDALSPRNVLDRGFAVLQDGAGRDLLSVSRSAPGSHLRAVLRDGTIDATVDRVSSGTG
jgi:exodeoxyribonuclease VII large subunit